MSYKKPEKEFNYEEFKNSFLDQEPCDCPNCAFCRARKIYENHENASSEKEYTNKKIKLPFKV